MSERRDPDDDLATLLADLDRTLGELRRELRDRERGGGDGDDRRPRRRPDDREADRYGYRRDDRAGRDRPLPRPPSFGEVLRFTEEYTIPTVISVLETTIRSLELLRRVLRLADPDRSVFDADDRRRSTTERLVRSNVGRETLSGVDRALDDLRDALADLPPDAESRDIVTDARDLMSEIESRIEEAEQSRKRSRYGYRRDRGRGDDDAANERRDGHDARSRRSERDRRRTDRGDHDPVTIDVSDAGGDDEDETEDDEAAQVDVDAELESIRREVRGGDDDVADATQEDSESETGETEEGRRDSGTDETGDGGA